MLSQHDDTAYAVALLEGGSARRAYLLKAHMYERDALIGAIREVARGGSVIDARVVDSLVVPSLAHAAQLPLAALTVREREVLSQMAQGKNNAAIARALVLTLQAVEKHINAIFSKLPLDEEPDVDRRRSVLLFLSEQA